jgi:separase
MKGATLSWKISYSLGKIAQEASCLKEALKHFSSAAEKITDEDPMALSLIQCRMAIIYLYLFKNNKVYPSVVESLATAALGLKSASRGSASDLEALLVESARLKKLAMAKLGELLSSDKNLPKGMLMSTMDFLHTFIRFLRRYISRQQPNAAEGETDVQMQAVISAKNIIITAAESAIALGKMSLLNQLPPWGDLQPIFSDSARLLNSFEQLETDDTEDGLDWRTTLVKLSNLFWSRYLKRKESGAGYEELIPLLDQSVSLLQGCPIAQRVTGFTTLKLERLAYLYLDARMGAKSIACFERSIQEYIDAGTLEQQIAYVSGKPPHVCLQDSKSPGFNLTRVLSSFLKMQLRRPRNDNIGIFEGKQLDVKSRGFLLEWQLSLLADFSSHDLSSEKFKSMFQELLSEILSLYSSDQYSVRRLRVVRLVLRFALDHPDSLETSTTESLAQDAQLHLSNFSADKRHGPYTPFITNSLKLLLKFRDGDVKEEDFQDMIAFWASTLRGCTDWESVQSVIDDYDILLAQAQAASGFLEARGYWKLQLAASEITLRIYEVQEARDSSSLILALSNCALQYCRLGDHQAALDLLDRAKRRLIIGDVSCYAIITYQLALAEFNMEINNIDSAEKALQEGQELFRSEEAKEEVQGSRSQSKIAWERLIVDGALLYSRLADQKKCLSEALYYGKLAVRLSTRLWTKLERSAGRKKELEKSADRVSDVDLVIDGVANIDLSGTVTSTMWTYAQGAVFWKHVASHNACFLNLMRLSAYNGLFQDAIYYGEQALKVNETLGLSVRLLTCQAELGLEWIRGNHLMDAKTVLDAATKISEGLINSVETVKLKISQAALSRSQGNYKEVLRLLHEAEAMLDRVSEVRLDSSINVRSSVAVLEEKMSLLKIRQASVQNEVKKINARTTRKTKGAPKPTEVEETIVAPTVKVQSWSFTALRNEIIRQQIHALLAIEDLDGASRLLQIARDTSSTATQVSIQIEETEHLLADAMKSIAAHAVYCVLPESTLSMPSIEAVISATKTAVARSKTPVTRKGRSAAKEPARVTKVAKEVDVADIMSRARSAISITVKDAVSTGSTVEGHTASSLMGRVSMLSHATTSGFVDEDILAPVNANGKSEIVRQDELY